MDLVIAGSLGLLFIIFPLFPHSSFTMATMIQFFMFSIYGMGWNTIGGYGGQVDLGKAQYVGIGAYTTTVMLIRWDIPFWFSMPVGLAFSVGWSFIIGYPLFRLKGHYFAIATIATGAATLSFSCIPKPGPPLAWICHPTRPLPSSECRPSARPWRAGWRARRSA